ncbi:MAG: MFS transporter [Eubacteriales bacterium]|nr:MFS transporter [Eubacteriales bacterium]
MTLEFSIALFGIYGFADMKFVFYSMLKTALNLNDSQLGMIWGIFGVIAMISYIGGGVLADRIAPVRLVSAALFISGILHGLMMAASFYQTNVFYYMMLISAGMGVCAVFLYYPASIRILSSIDEKRTGVILGTYYGVGGILTASMDIAAILFYSKCENEALVFRVCMIFFAITNVMMALLIHQYEKKIVIEQKNRNVQNGINNEKEYRKMRYSQIINLLKEKSFWYLALVMLCNYSFCCLMSYYMPYLTERFGIRADQSMMISSIRMGAFCLLGGVLWGKWRDRKKSTFRVMEFSAIGMLCLFLILYENETWFQVTWIAVAVTSLLSLISLGVKSIAISAIQEIDIDTSMAGMVIGWVSFIGYSPDAFYYPIAGKIFEFHGMHAYGILFVMGIIGALISILITKLQKSGRYSV